MNKSQLIDQIAGAAELSKAGATRALDAITSAITSELASGGKVEIVGFGKFETKQRAARTGRNPATGEPLEIAASVQPSFKAGKALKDACNQ